MTTEERIAMIDNKVAADKAKKEACEIALAERRKNAEQKLRELKPRIDEIIKVGNYAVSKGFNINKSGCGGHEGYDTGLFFSNGWSHHIGFINETPIRYVGIVAGGACGEIDFWTDGDVIAPVEHSRHKVIKGAEVPIYTLEHFVNGFEKFETEFYAYIDKLCGEE